ncbi:hypothetical protein C8J57DRAFT_1545704 [Mycena rebaudengoi]|nr:hypothetical protein C8J57DRAFT_1545704 [Mycena rebaudengoi]
MKINHSFDVKHMLPHIPQHILLHLAPRPQAVFLQHAQPGTAYRVEVRSRVMRCALPRLILSFDVERLPGIGVSSLLWCSLGALRANREATTRDPPPGCKLELSLKITQLDNYIDLIHKYPLLVLLDDSLYNPIWGSLINLMGWSDTFRLASCSYPMWGIVLTPLTSSGVDFDDALRFMAAGTSAIIHPLL